MISGDRIVAVAYLRCCCLLQRARPQARLSVKKGLQTQSYPALEFNGVGRYSPKVVAVVSNIIILLLLQLPAATHTRRRVPVPPPAACRRH
eukprot:1038296-Rhodomonas_salina.2